MTTLTEHIQNLTRFTDDTEEEIFCSILNNKLVMDDDSLFSFYVEHNVFGIWMTVMWIDGDGKKIYKWIKDAKTEYNCDKVYFVSKRWKAMNRKYKDLKIKPLGVLCEIGGI